MPLLSRWGLVLGVAILFAIVILGGNLFGGEANRVNVIADPLAELPAFPAGTVPADAPPSSAAERPKFALWALERAFGNWGDAFKQAGRAWQDPTGISIQVSSVPADDPQADAVLAAGLKAAEYVEGILGIPGRIELARRQKPELEPQLDDQREAMLLCLAGAWGRTLLPPDRLAKAAPAPQAKYVRLGAEIGDPEVCDTFSADGGR